MKFLWKENVFGWVMTGICGKEGKWFLGFSKAPTAPSVMHQLLDPSSVNKPWASHESM